MGYKKRNFLVTLTLLAFSLSACGGSSGEKTDSSQKTSSSTSETTSASSEGQSSASSSSEATSTDITSESETSDSSGESQRTLESIIVKEDTVPTHFAVGDTFSVDGGILLLNYDNQDIEELPMTLDMIINPPEMDEEEIDYTVYVSYLGLQASYTIDVVLEVTKITVKEGTDLKTIYNVGEEFTVENGQLVVSYSDGTRSTIDMTLEMVDEIPDMDKPAENLTVNLTYENAKTSYQITIIDRITATIGVSYTYNYSEYTEITDFTEELEFTQGKDYHFDYGVDPVEAIDSIYYQYIKRGYDGGVLGARPTEVGEYTYRVYIPNDDETYKPTEVLIDYQIVEPIIVDVVLDNNTATPLTDEEGDANIEVEGLNINFKKAKAAEEGIATLVKGPGSYIEISDPTAFTSDITAIFEGINNYLLIYASYDGVEYVLVDTLTFAKSTTNRAKDYFYVRLCSNPIDVDEMVIKSISFSYEALGAPNSGAAKAENSDLGNTATSDEGNVYFSKSSTVFDVEKSKQSIGILGKELSVNIQFNTTLKEEEIKRYNLEFYYRPTDNATYQASRTDTTPSETIGIYAKPTNVDKATVGSHLKIVDGIPAGSEELEWTKVVVNLVAFFDAEGLKGDISGINVWLNRYCATGRILFDDFRLVQKDSYPEARALSYLTLEGEYQTTFDKGDEFVFDGQVVAHYTDWASKYIALDDEGLAITAPQMTTSGKKTVEITYTDNGVSKKVGYIIEVIGTDPKAEETLPIIEDDFDLASASHQYKSTHSYDKGIATDETDNTYNDSTNAIKVTGLTLEDYYLYLKLDRDLTSADGITLRLFAKGFTGHTLYFELYSEDESEKAYRDASQVEQAKPKGSASTEQGKSSSMTYTDAGNDWGRYEYTFYSAHLTKPIRLLRVAITDKLTASEFFYLDGIEVFSATIN